MQNDKRNNEIHRKKKEINGDLLFSHQSQPISINHGCSAVFNLQFTISNL
jgi:hypothetical protein